MRKLDKYEISNFNNAATMSLDAENVNEDELFVRVEIDEKEAERIVTDPYSYWRSVFRVFIRKPAAIIGVTCLIILILGIVIIPFFVPEGALVGTISKFHLKPSDEHIWGNDSIGRDMFYAVWVGARKSLILALISSAINIFLGTVFGLAWGFFKKLDRLFIEIYNLVSNIPSLLIYMLLGFILIQSFPYMKGEMRLIISLTLTGWVGLARFVRNQVLIITNREYNIASYTLGTPARRIMTRNLLPYISSVIITEASIFIPAMISSEVSMSFFGVGLIPGSLSLGSLLDLGRTNFTEYPHELLVPTAVLAFIIFTFFLLGLALSDALDPKKHR